MNIGDDTGLVSDEELRRGPRRPWLGPHRPSPQRWVRPMIEILHVEAAGGVALFIPAFAVAAGIGALILGTRSGRDCG